MFIKVRASKYKECVRVEGNVLTPNFLTFKDDGQLVDLYELGIATESDELVGVTLEEYELDWREDRRIKELGC